MIFLLPPAESSSVRGVSSPRVSENGIRQTLDPDKTYYIRFKSVLDKLTPEFYMDGLEWCPKEVYDNPEKPEDIW